MDFSEIKISEILIPLDEVFIDVELANDVVAGREDEGVGIVVFSADELIVASSAIEGVSASAAIEGVVAFAAMELVVVFKTKDEVVLIGAIEFGALWAGGGCCW